MKKWLIKEWLKFIDAHDYQNYTLVRWKLHGFSVCGAIWKTMAAVIWVVIRTCFFIFMAWVVLAFPIETATHLYISGRLPFADMTEIGQVSSLMWGFLFAVTIIFWIAKGVVRGITKLWPNFQVSVPTCAIASIKLPKDVFPGG